jgi:hypothetical protein
LRVGWREDEGPAVVLAREGDGAVGVGGYLGGPDTFSAMAFPVLRFVNVTLRAPVTRAIWDPSEPLSSLMYSLLRDGKVTPTANP